MGVGPGSFHRQGGRTEVFFGVGEATDMGYEVLPWRCFTVRQ